jgi:hypothetical protein
VLRQVLEPTDPPIQWVPDVLLLEQESDHSLPSSAKVKNECCHAFTASTEVTLYSTQRKFSASHVTVQYAVEFYKPLHLRKFIQQSYERM